ncbi:solute carrier family 2, facilitated glucose transporter member 7 isoform X2 [Drosophila grimshawi]|uniref:GH21903 n=1 Tax=Drosophila grimshawi TaxID=7222 RepID=B4J838_DROGR|nr:solute carrier family 2, facilitated glucose transporter member 7 isoform X2 [Drosophila grimshawi]EDW02268.1 GH21903 [Drosophila grimshawi]
MADIMHVNDEGEGWTWLLLLICVTTTVGTTVPVGYFIGVLNAPAEIIRSWCDEVLSGEYDTNSDENQLNLLWTCIVSIFLIGGICGSCISACCTNKYGRKGTLMISSVILLLCGLLFTWCRAAKSLEMLMCARFFGGIAAALIFTAHPMYLLELAPVRLSGSVGVFTCIGVTAGILLAQIVSLPQLLGTDENWPYALSFYALLVLLCMLPLMCYPESPRWLFLVKGNAASSARALRQLRGRQAGVQQELNDLEQALNMESKPSTICQVLRNKELFLPLLLVCTFQATQQLSGINAIFFYSLSILTNAGFTSDSATWLNLGMGGFNLACSLLGPVLLRKFNRRPLMFCSCILCSLSLAGMSLSLYFLLKSEASALTYVSIAFILSFILGFQLGLGPIAYFIGSELLEDAPRPVAMSMGSLFSWTGNFLIGMCFPLLQTVWGSFAFMPCMCVCIFCLVLTWRYLPETRGREPKDVSPLMSQGLRSKNN